MRKSYTRGSRWLLCLSVLLLGFSLSTWGNTVNNMRDVETLYLEGNQFDGDSGYSMIKVLGIEELDVEDEKLLKDEKFYLLESEKAFVILRSSRRDLRKVIGDNLSEDGKFKKFVNQDIYARINGIPEERRQKRKTYVYIPQDLQKKFKTAFKNSLLARLRLEKLSKEYKNQKLLIEEIKKRPFYYNVYIEPTGIGYHVFNVIFSICLSVATYFAMLFAGERIRWAKESYQRLFETYPEVEWDMAKLISEASYIDKRLKVLVYKDSIVVYKSIFDFEELGKIKSIVFDKVTRKGQVVGYTIHIKRKDRVSNFNFKIGYGEKDKHLIRDLGSYLEREYSLNVIYKF